MPKLDAKLLTQAAYARHRGVSRPAVGKALREGRITLTPEGLIDPVAADAQWQANTRPRVKVRDERPATAAPASLDDDAISYQEARRREAVADALTAEIRLLELRKTVITVDAVTEVMGRLLGNAKQQLLGLPSRVAPLLAHAQTPAEVKLLLDKEIWQILTDLSDGAKLAGVARGDPYAEA